MSKSTKPWPMPKERLERCKRVLRGYRSRLKALEDELVELLSNPNPYWHQRSIKIERELEAAASNYIGVASDLLRHKFAFPTSLKGVGAHVESCGDDDEATPENTLLHEEGAEADYRT